MGSTLLENFNEKTKKSKVAGSNSEAEFDVAYSTGFLAMDFINGTTIHVESKERNFSYTSAGIVDGSCNTIIGRSGSGKSTLLMQICGNIVRPFIEKEMDTMLLIDDLEGSLPQVRKEFLLGLSQDQLDKYVESRNTGITTENLFDRLKIIHDTKLENKKHYTYDTGCFDTYGNRIFKLVPTVYVVDSLPLLMPQELVDDTELGGGMDSSSMAKKNTFLFKKIAQLCKEANIIFFTINHILEEINMGFIPKAAQISGLKQGERLPGGRAALYLANNMFRVDDTNTLKEDKDYGINGSVVMLTVIKSRTNCTKVSVPLIFNKSEGRFDELLSLFHLAKQEALFNGVGANMYLDSCPDVKFGMKSFKDVFLSSPELQSAFAKEIYKVLSGYLADTKRVAASTTSTIFSLNNMVMDIANSNE